MNDLDPRVVFLQRVQQGTGTANTIKGNWLRLSGSREARFEIGFRGDGELWASAHLYNEEKDLVDSLFDFLTARADLIQEQAGTTTGALTFDPMEGRVQARIVARCPIPDRFSDEAVKWCILAVRKLDEVLRPHLTRWHDGPRPRIPAQRPSAPSPAPTPEHRYRQLTLLVEKRRARTPARTHVASGDEYVRDPRAREAVLAVCGNRCENPQCAGLPEGLFRDGRALLDVDHVLGLGEDGVDHPSNMVALCPNCHRMKHEGDARDTLRRVLAKVAAERNTRLMSLDPAVAPAPRHPHPQG
ncbi:HNH endonuclease [Kitasatospora sp. NPDC098652]|uniref:HNH endonuclease n=1 Tax=Kitasatospora sp. NPDC098652 TaxID=3364095 RepID=UPI003818C93F